MNEEIQHLSGGLFEIYTYVYLHARLYTHIPISWSSHHINVQENVRERKLELICVLL